MSARLSEAFLRKTFNAAAGGDIAAFQRLEKLSHRNQDIFLRTSALAFQFLKDTDFGAKISYGPREEDVRAAIAIELLGGDAAGEEGLGLKIASMKTHLLDDATSIMDSMYHLYSTWAYDSDTGGLRRIPTSPVLTTTSAVLEFQSKVLKFVPRLLSGMVSQHAELCHILKDHTSLGPLLSHIMLSYAQRGDLPTLIHQGRAQYFLLHNVEGSDRPWQKVYYKNLESNATIYAKGMISQMHTLAQTPYPKFPRDFHDIDQIVRGLLNCTNKSDILLLACLGQENATRDMGVIICRLIRYMEDQEPRLESFIRDMFYRVIGDAAEFLDSAFQYGGQYFAFKALKTGLFELLLTLRKLVTDSIIIDGSYFDSLDRMDKSLASLVQAVIPLVVYPRVLRALDGFVKEFEAQNVKDDPLNLYGLERVLIVLKARTDEEWDVVRWMSRAHQAKPEEYSNPDKLCDNHSCPNALDPEVASDAKRGRCTACRSGYYCSRACQKAVWKNGHREECKDIITARQAHKDPGLTCAFTIHDREQLRGTSIARFHYYFSKRTLPPPPRDPEESNGITLRLSYDTHNPVTLEWHVCNCPPPASSDSTPGCSQEGGHGHCDDHAHGQPGIALRVSFPTSEKHNRFIAFLSPGIELPKGIDIE